jgi:EmrB/QacA subfamily drug resistance transporter
MSLVSETGQPPTDAQPDPRRWRAFGVLGLIQFMLVLDMTVVTVALPRIQHDLSFSAQGLPWVINGYVVMAGGLLLLGGRLADIIGRRRLFLIGVAVFVAASAVCGFATSPGMLIAARFAQGVGQALATPAALGLIALLFPDMRERFKALGMWGGIAGMAGTLGPVISGVLTDLASWRWIFFINLPIGIFALVVAPRLVTESRMTSTSKRIDIIGAVTVTGGLIAVVYGLLRAASYPWGSLQVLGPLLGGVVLLVLFVVAESVQKAPLIPLRFLANRVRWTANITTLLLAAAFFTFSFLLSLFMQNVLGYSPLNAGLALLPFAVAIGLGITATTKLLPRFGVRPVLVVGFLGSALGMFLLGQISVSTHYLTGLLPGLIVLGFFYGSCFPATTNAAMHALTRENSGLVSGVQTTSQQIGGALGLATLATLALRHTASDVAKGVPPREAVTSGYALSFGIAAGLLVLCALLVLFVMENIKPQPRAAAPAEPKAADAQTEDAAAASG